MQVPRNQLFPSYEGLALIIEELKVSLVVTDADGTITIFFQDPDKEYIVITPVTD